jgi:DNA-binding transcriptional MerR regulator
MAMDYPSKLYYSISEVARIVGVKAHVLRYWETEFPTLRPRKTRTGSRRYRQADIEELLAIKKLLYEEGFKIAGAKKVRREARSQAASDQGQAPAQMALGFDDMDEKARREHIIAELRQIQALLAGLKAAEPATDEASEPLKKMEQEG